MFPVILKMSYELFSKLATEVFGDAKMEAYYQTWKLSKTPVSHSHGAAAKAMCVVEEAKVDLMRVCDLGPSDTYRDHEYGGGSKPCSLAPSNTYADHEYGEKSTTLKKYAFTPAQPVFTYTPPNAPKKAGSNVQSSEDDAMEGITKKLFQTT